MERGAKTHTPLREVNKALRAGAGGLGYRGGAGLHGAGLAGLELTRRDPLGHTATVVSKIFKEHGAAGGLRHIGRADRSENHSLGLAM